jgi:hypothetical protein
LTPSVSEEAQTAAREKISFRNKIIAKEITFAEARTESDQKKLEQMEVP